MNCSRQASLPSGRAPAGTRIPHAPCGGFILITTLVLLSALTLLTVALYSLSINDTIQSRNFTDGQRSQLAADSAFEAARALLLDLTRRDDYLVTAGHDTDPNPKRISPYHFVSFTQADGSLRHIPLWAGGIIQQTPPDEAPRWARSGSLPHADAVLAGLWELAVRQSPGRVPLQPVYTSWISGEILPGNEDGRLRYTFWIEDMEGLPQLDVIGSVTPDTPQTIRLGYSRFDPRAPDFLSTARFRSGAGYGTRFPALLSPASANGSANSTADFPFPQPLLDAIAPGLSPKEVNLPAGPFNGSLATSARAAARSGHILTSGGAGSFDDHLSGITAVGLRPYLRVPYVPKGLGYPGEGLPKTNLNALLSEGPEAVAQHLREHLPEPWQQRGGAFPDDYLATLAANIVDYADEDGLPSTLPAEGALPVRGFESYPVVSECYYRFRWISALPDDPDAPTKITVRIGVTPFVEFWNQTNRPFPAAPLSLVYAEGGQTLATTYRAEFGAELHVLDLGSLEHIISHQTAGGSLVLTEEVALPENGYQLVQYPTVTYEFPELGLQPGEERPEEFTFTGEGGDFDIGTYKILWEDRLIDWAAAGTYRSPASFRWEGAGSSPPARQRLRGGDGGHNYLKNNIAGLPAPSSPILNPGDPRMTYYFREHVQEENDYVRDATLGARNAHGDADVETPGSQVDLEFWPDGGYLTATVPHPAGENTDPVPGNPHAENYAELDDGTSIGGTAPDGATLANARAPFRLSNLGRYFSLSELGNVYDPIMYPSSQKDNAPLQWLDLPASGTDGGAPGGDALAQGGGNTLRIGRPEHPALLAAPAAQLLDIFHVGINGTNLPLPPGQPYHPALHLQPPSPRDAASATHHPHSYLYGPALHAESPFKAIRGRLNLNTASVGALRMLLEGTLAMDAGYGDETGLDGRHPIQSLASEIYLQRPFTSLSQLAALFHRNPPIYRQEKTQNPDSETTVDGPRFATSDAVHEEPFARVLNLGQLSSRHFRIHVAGDYLPAGKPSRIATEQRVYEVFLRPVHDLQTGELLQVRCEVLNMRDR